MASGIADLPCMKPAEVGSAGKVPADLLGAEGDGAADSEHDAVFVASGRSARLALTGAVYADSIRDQMAEIEQQYGQGKPEFSKIALSDIDFGFEAKLTLPEGMAFPAGLDSAKLVGSNDFEVKSVSVAGQTATVVFGLTDAAKAKITTYEQLKAVVDAVKSPLSVTLAGVSFTDSSVAGTEYTVTGSVVGHFSALASKSATTGGRDIKFAFTWTGEQKSGLEDAKKQPGITFTTKYSPEPAEVGSAGKVPADLLGAEGDGAADSEHDAVFVASGRSARLALTGAVYADSIRDQMAEIEQQYGQGKPEFSKIALSDIDFGFEAKLTLPEGMAFPAGLDSAKLVGSNDFEVKSVSVAGQTATVVFGLTDAAKAKITTYEQLKAVVDAVKSPLSVTLAGVSFTDSSVAGTEYTVTGSVVGHFSALASKSATTGGRDIKFAFTWTGEQKSGLEDAKKQPGITFTTKYKAEPPVTPDPTPAPSTEPTVKPSDPAAKPGTPAARPVKSLANTGASVGGAGVLALALIGAGALALNRKRNS